MINESPVEITALQETLIMNKAYAESEAIAEEWASGRHSAKSLSTVDSICYLIFTLAKVNHPALDYKKFMAELGQGTDAMTLTDNIATFASVFGIHQGTPSKEDGELPMANPT